MISWKTKTTIVMNANDVFYAIEQYDRYVLNDGIDFERSIDGRVRADLPHRKDMPLEWWAYLTTSIDLARANGNSPDLFGFAIDLFDREPTQEEILCLIEDRLAIAERFRGDVAEPFLLEGVA